MTTCPDVTCYYWEAITASHCHIPWGSHSSDDHPNGLSGPRAPITQEDTLNSAASVRPPARPVVPTMATRGRQSNAAAGSRACALL